jgi:transglutaminase-like putative cysteine protease/tetratricopeptide (TPR) repeat protein
VGRLGQRWAFLLPGLALACATGPAPRAVAPPPPIPDPLPGPAAGAAPVEDVSEVARYVVAADGTKTLTYTLRYRVRSLRDLGPFATLQAEWAPWYQARPELTATVTWPDGRAFPLEPGAVAEAPVESRSPGLYTDRRKLEAPLPGLREGAWVEHTVVQRDARAVLPGGAWGRFAFGMGAPVARSTLELVVPEGVPLTYQVRGAALTPESSTEGDARVLRFTLEDLPARGPTRLHLPPEQPRHPHVVFTTVPSWAAVAEAYGALVERQLAGADVSALLTGLDPAASPREKLERLLARVHAEIRYTGLELGEQAILPRAPAETLARRFGDCKDKGALLVALLRAAGVPAHLALVRAGLGEDVVPELPGLEPFNHALVYVPGSEPVFVDATQDLLPVGELPVEVQGRYALVAAAGGPGLVTLPEAPAAHNRYTEVRKVTFADFGPVSVVERTSATGSMELRMRRQLADASRSQVAASLGRYVERAYKAPRLGGFLYANPRDVGQPFSVELEALGAQVGYTARTEARVQLRTPVLFGFIPDFLKDASLGQLEGEQDPERRAANLLARTRQADLLLPEAFVAEVRYEVKLPPDFVPAPEARAGETVGGAGGLPAPLRVAMGPATYAVAVTPPGEDGTVVVTFTLDMGKRRYTADEVRAFILGLAQVWELDVPTLRLRHRGSQLMAEGKVKEGLQIFRSRVAARPDDAAPRARYAEALLEVGMGDAARVEARAAAALDEGSAPIQMTLARVLEHDRFGRRFAPGFDRAGAIQAFERVLALDPDQDGARAEVARLLELDDRGVESSDPAAWRAAAEAYRALRDRTGDTEQDAQLLRALYGARDFEALLALARGLPPQPGALIMQLTGAAELHGVQAALRELGSLGLAPAERQEVLEGTVSALAQLRDYPLAREVAQAAAASSADASSMQRLAALFGALRRVVPADLAGDTPTRAVERLLFAMLSPGVDAAQVASLMASRAQAEGAAAGPEQEALAAQLAGLRRAAPQLGGTLEMARDQLLSLTRFVAEGDREVGYRVTGRLEGPRGSVPSTWFVVRERGEYKVRAALASPSAVGEEALLLAQRGRVAAARRWLGWAADMLKGVPEDPQDPLHVLPFVALVRASAPEATQAAALVAMGPRAGRAVAALEAARKKLEDPSARLAVDHALLMALERTGDEARALEVAGRLMAAAPGSERGVLARCQALVATGARNAAMELAVLRMAAQAQDAAAIHCLASAAVDAGKVREAMKWLERLDALTPDDPTLLNNLAWLALFTGDPITDVDMARAVRANALSGFEDPARLHTLATLHAERGETREALSTFLTLLERRGSGEPESVDWYLLGRIMEHYELVAEARAAYLRVEPERRSADATFALAQRRLRALEAAP